MAQNKAHQLLQLAIDSQITQYAAGWTFIFLRVSLSRGRSAISLMAAKKNGPLITGGDGLETFKIPDKMVIFVIRQTPSNEMQGTSATLIISVVDIILFLRIWILCDRSRRIMWARFRSKWTHDYDSMHQVEFGVMLGIITATVNSVRDLSRAATRKSHPHPTPLALIFEARSPQSCSMFIVTVQNCRRRIAVSRPYSTHSIAMVFLRDGVLWFLVAALLAPPQIALFAWGRPTLLQVLMLWVQFLVQLWTGHILTPWPRPSFA
ncbi:hypothetical protein DFH08DRAFT_824741 [Mycena albidolilacea]|uniref:Uncharacterized protein n=1 Tax=Mycena albidolilacea TaxID=1033008 RepID=A0AAD6Z4G7_9AGAR|nr:hypothetical protein DFH08DRAFT_824741 [Mycena albidolilacea]